MNTNYPRVLVVSSSNFNPFVGTSATISNLFRGWPKDRLAMIHSDNLFEPDLNICNRYFKHEQHERKILYYSTIKSIFKKIKYFHSSNNNMSLEEITTSKNYNSSKHQLTDKKIFRVIGKLFGNLEPLGRIDLSDKMKQWILEFQPEVIYSPISSITYIKFIFDIQALTKAKIAVHFMDDWPSVIYKKGILGPLFRLQMKRNLRNILARAKIRICIGSAMSEEYESRYGYKFLSFSNPEDSKIWEEISKNSIKKDDSFKMLYVGTFNSKNIKTIGKLCDVVEKLHRNGINIHMEIYSFQPRADIYRSKFERKGSVAVKEVPKSLKEFRKLLCSGDLLIIPLDYSRESIDRMQLSFFTKIPAYMLSGVPILICGPMEIRVVQQAKKEGWAYVVSEDSGIVIKDAIITLMNDSELRSKLPNRARDIARKRHDAKLVREQFRTIFSSVCEAVYS